MSIIVGNTIIKAIHVNYKIDSGGKGEVPDKVSHTIRPQSYFLRNDIRWLNAFFLSGISFNINLLNGLKT